MPNVLNEFAGDGVTRTFNFSMTGGYLSRDYVHFFTRPNDDLLNYTPYNGDDVTWLTDFSVRTANPIPIGTTFVILRSTTLDPLVDFQNTSRITEKNLDTATWQSIHIAAETSDTVGRIQVVATDAKAESTLALTLAQEAAADAAASVASASAAQALASASQVVANNAMATANEVKDWVDEAVAGAVISFNGRSGTVTPQTGDYTKAMVGLSNVDNTSDVNKPVSAAQSNAIGLKADKSYVDTQLGTKADTATVNSALATKVDAWVVSAALDAKANKTDVTNALALKADKSYVDTQLGTKVSQTDLTNALALKADTAAMNAALSSNATADRNRANHTGTQPYSTVSGLGTVVTKDHTLSPADHGSKRVTLVGDFGLGANYDGRGKAFHGNLAPNMFFSKGTVFMMADGGAGDPTALGIPGLANYSYGVLTIHAQYIDASALHAIQRWFMFGGRMWQSMPLDATTWGPWREYVNSGNISTFTAGAASKLAVVRSINGQPFDGTQNVDIPMLGRNQNWVLVSRTPGVTYYNTTGAPIVVNVTADATNATVTIHAVIGGTRIRVAGESSSGQPRLAGNFIVPPGASYVLESTVALGDIHELRQ